MSKLEDLRTNAAVKGILPDALVTVAIAVNKGPNWSHHLSHGVVVTLERALPFRSLASECGSHMGSRVGFVCVGRCRVRPAARCGPMRTERAAFPRSMGVPAPALAL